MSSMPLTHRSIDRRLSGSPLELGEGRASVVLETTPEMAADELGLVHGGFVLSAADHAAMQTVFTAAFTGIVPDRHVLDSESPA